jgi:hypothetical protein
VGFGKVHQRRSMPLPNPVAGTPSANKSHSTDQSGPDRAEPGHRRLPRISLRCTDLPPVPAARQLGLAADSDRPQAEAAKARSGPERVLPSYTRNSPRHNSRRRRVRIGEVLESAHWSQKLCTFPGARAAPGYDRQATQSISAESPSRQSTSDFGQLTALPGNQRPPASCVPAFLPFDRGFPAARG